ncbi:MAG: division/cell wall cluster transcriptional repressor MraZ [bacterium]|nr:division/cell wall cluster transcriptional repressor MraZ [bacterium]
MLIGKYQNNMDAKKRVPIPAKFRDLLGKTVIITRGLEDCLFVYSMADWQEFADKLSKLPLSQESARSFARLMFSGAMEVELDDLGRVLIPEYLKSHAQLKKEAVIIGAGNRLEIWDKEKWEKYQMNETGDMSETVADLKEFGL